MNTTQANNLRVLADHMDRISRTLYMDATHHCGTPACAIGECSAIPSFDCDFENCGDIFIRVRGHVMSYASAARNLFGVDNGTGLYALFANDIFNAFKSNEVMPQQWAIEARKVLAAHGYPAVAPVLVVEPDGATVYAQLLQRLQVREPA